jgi:hypothetical protein
MKMASARVPYHACVWIMTCDFVLITANNPVICFLGARKRLHKSRRLSLQYIEKHSPKQVEFKVVVVQPHKRPLVRKNKGLVHVIKV